MKKRKLPYGEAWLEIIEISGGDIVTASGGESVDTDDIKDNISSDTWL